MQWLVMAGSWAMTTRGAQLEWGTDCLEFKEPRGQAIGRIIYIVTEMVKKKDGVVMDQRYDRPGTRILKEWKGVIPKLHKQIIYLRDLESPQSMWGIFYISPQIYLQNVAIVCQFSQWHSLLFFSFLNFRSIYRPNLLFHILNMLTCIYVLYLCSSVESLWQRK